MTVDQYLAHILQREAVDTSIASPVRLVQYALNPIIQRWGNGMVVGVSPSGSFAKGTANHSGTDIDLFISVSPEVTVSLSHIYQTLFNALKEAGYSPRKQNVSLNIRVDGIDVDLVPARRHDFVGEDHSLYRRRADTWTKTNVAKHVAYVWAGGRLQESRIIKLWRDQKGLDFPSFYIELSVIRALNGQHGGIGDNVWKVFQYLRDSFTAARIVDPANTNNVISDDLTEAEKINIQRAAVTALSAKTWGEIVQ